MLQDIVLSPACPIPPEIILKLTFLVLGTTVLPSARCVGQVHPTIAFALGLKRGSVETQDFSGNTASGTMGEELELEVGWGLGGPLSP